MQLELALDPDHARLFTRLALLAPLKRGRPRSRAIRIIWHDGPNRELADQGLALAEQRPQWRLERLQPGDENWPPGAPAPVLATGRDPDALGFALPAPRVAVAAFEGRAITLDLSSERGPVALTLLSGGVRAIASEQRASRVRLEGAGDIVQHLALMLAGEVPLAVPRASLAAEALAVASGTAPPPRRDGAPRLPGHLSIPDAFAHVVGHLGDVILYFALDAATGKDGPEPVHQMRVAVRRLRSAIKVFRRTVGCPAVDAVDAGLKALAGKLAPTRDWDVFATETAVQVGAAFPTEPRLQRLLLAVERRRAACQAELRSFLGSVEFRRLGIAVACLAAEHAWPATPDRAEYEELTVYAAEVLNKRLKKLVRDEDTLSVMQPAELHALRLRAKRLRYAAEIFAPLYPGKGPHRFIRALGRLQDQLGALNDGAVAGSLLRELSGNHAFATGLVLGFIGARNAETRQGIDKAWNKFSKAPQFWT